MDIGEAVDHLRVGNFVRREGWNGKGMYLFFRPGHLATDQILDPLNNVVEEVTMEDVVYMRTAQGMMVPWLCSQTDLLAQDWEVVS